MPQKKPTCLKCKAQMVRSGKTVDGRQVWRCKVSKARAKACGKSTQTENPKAPHRPRQGAEPVSGADRVRACRQRKKDLNLNG